MPDLLRLPLRAIDLATRPSRFVLGKLLELRHSDDDQVAPAAQPERPRERPRPEPPQSAPPRKRTPAKKASTSAKAARRATRHEPTKGQAAAMRQRQRMEEQDAGAAGGPGATITVAEPWDGYGQMSEEQVLERLTGADAGLRAAVRLYEGTHANRQQIIYATDETPA